MKLPIPTDWDGESYCCWAVEWPDSEMWAAILRGFITLPQRGWTWDEKTGSIVNTQSIGREITQRNLPERYCIVACNDPGLSEIAVAINALAAATRAMADAQCCTDLQIDPQGGNQGEVIQPSGEVIPVFGSQPPIGMPPGTFPPSYPDEESYLSDKCKKANTIVDGLISTLTNIAGFGTFNAIALAGLIAAAIAFGVIFPPSLIPVAISILLILSGGLFLVAQLNAAIIENREDVVCILYTHDSTTAIISTLADLLDILISGVTTVGRLAYALKALVLLIVNSDTLNQLFDASVAMGNSGADCSGCQECTDIAFEFIEPGTGGWSAQSAMPACFGFSDPPLASLSNVDEKLVVVCEATEGGFAGAITIGGGSFFAQPGWELLLRINRIGATSLYVDAIYELEDESCVWTTITNNDTLGGFHDITNSHVDVNEHTITNLTIYLSTADTQNGLTVQIEHIRLLCQAP